MPILFIPACIDSAKTNPVYRILPVNAGRMSSNPSVCDWMTIRPHTLRPNENIAKTVHQIAICKVGFRRRIILHFS